MPKSPKISLKKWSDTFGKISLKILKKMVEQGGKGARATPIRPLTRYSGKIGLKISKKIGPKKIKKWSNKGGGCATDAYKATRPENCGT